MKQINRIYGEGMKNIEINLKQREEDILKRITKQGKEPVRKVKRAQILLLVNKKKKTNDIAEILDVCAETVSRTKKKYIKNGLDYAINERKRQAILKKLMAEQKLELIA